MPMERWNIKTILLIGESGGNRNGMRIAAEKLNDLWKDSSARAFWVDDYYTKSHADQNKYVTEKFLIPVTSPAHGALL
jgi:hypothetical protein